MITAHRINNDSQGPLLYWRFRIKLGALLYFRGNDLFTLVATGDRANAVRKPRFITFTVHAGGDNRKLLMRTTLALTGFRMLSFWIWHFLLLFKTFL